jgi:hypothetical protein
MTMVVNGRKHLAATASDIDDDRTVVDACQDKCGLEAGKVMCGDVDDLACEAKVVAQFQPLRPKRHLKNIRTDGKKSRMNSTFLPSSKPRPT